jgi:hypothetical protein
MPSIHRRHSRQQLLCIYLLLTHACIVYICVWHHSRQRRKIRAHLRVLSTPSVLVPSKHTISLEPSNSHACTRMQAAVFIANYSSISSRMRASNRNIQTLTFLRHALLQWSSTHTQSNVFVLLPNSSTWPSVCTDLRAPLANTCSVHSLLIHSKLDAMHWLQELSAQTSTCVKWDTVLMLESSDVQNADTAEVEHAGFASIMLTRMRAAPASRATCLQKQEIRRQQQSCLISVWKTR